MTSPSLDKNPYSAPNSNLEGDIEFGGRQFVPEGMAVGVDRVVGWFGRGFEFFKAAPLQWILTCIVMFVIMMVLAFIPILGALITYILFPILMGGVMLGCVALARNEPYTVGHLFAGFQSRGSTLAMVGLLYLVELVVLGIVIGIVMVVAIGGSGLGAMMGAMSGNKEAAGAMFAGGFGIGMLFAFLIGMLLGIPIFMSILFAPVLVVVHGFDAVQAMRASFTGCMKNILPGIVYIILYMIFAILAMIPLGLGLLVLMPVIMASQFASYEDIYLR